MKKSKRILSAITALAISASAFASMVIPASAAETTVYTLTVPSTDATVTKKVSDAANAADANVPDFGTATTLTPAVAELDGWGYIHYAYDGTDGRQTNAHTVTAENAFYSQGVGNGGSSNRAYISFIPANANVTVDDTKTYIYSFDAYSTTTGGNKTSDSLFGFTTSANGASVTDPGNSYIRIAASGVVNQAVKKSVVMVNDRAAGTYATYVDGIRQINGNSADITGIYASSPGAAYIKAGIGNLVVKEADAAPAAVKVTFKGDSDATLSEVTALSGAELTAPEPPSITGKTFVKWQKDGVDMAENEAFTAGSTDTVFTAVYREGADYSNIVVTSTPYTKVELTLTTKASDLDDSSLTQDKIEGYTDGKGAFTASHVVRGDYSYKLTKTGYTTKEGTFTLLIQDYALNETLALTDNQSGCLLYSETDFVAGAGNFGIGSKERAKDLTLPDIDLDEIKTISFDLAYSDTAVDQYTLMFMNDDNVDVVGLQGTLGNSDIEAGLYAFTGFTGKGGASNDDYNQQNATGKYESGVKLLDSYEGTNRISITFNPTSKMIAVHTGSVTKTLTLTKEDFTIDKIRVGKYRDQGGAVYIDNLTVTTPDPNEVLVTGDDAFAKIAGKTVTRQYTATPALYVEGEEFAWTAVDSTTNQAVTGITIDDNGLLSVEDTATVPTTLKITATSKTTPAKKGEVTATVNDFATLTPTIEGPKAIETGDSATYKVTKIMDNYDDDVTEYFTPVWTINGQNTDTSVTFTGLTPGKATAITAKYDDTELESVFVEEVTIPSNGTLEYSTAQGAKVMLWKYPLSSIEPLSSEVKETHATGLIEEGTVATVGGKSGEVTTYETDGTFILTVTLAAGQTATYPVKVDKYYDIVDYEEQSTVDVENLVEDAAITGYLVTLSDDDDVKVAELVTDAATAQATGAVVPEVPAGKTATQLEVAPVFTTTIGTEIAIPSNRYNITLAANNGGRTDVYVNNQMVVNNLNQGDDGWSPARVVAAGTYNIGDVVIAEGYAKFKYDDNQDGRNLSVDSIKVSKAPEIVNRAQRVYVVGDSLVATYYGSTGTEANDKLARTGWGQVLGNYLKNVEVTNLGNSGAWATAMLANAYTNIAASAQPGDIVVWESGYNDTKHGGIAPMKAAIKVAIDECKAKGVKFYLVTPNASNHDYRAKVESSEGIRELAKETNTPLIDLATISYDFFVAHYGEEKALLRPTYNNNADNGLHSSCNAANVFASIVAQGLYDAGETDIVNTEYTYTFTDTKTTPETFNIKVTPSAE